MHPQKARKPFLGRHAPRSEVTDDEYEYPARSDHAIDVHFEDQREPEFTGILTSDGFPLFRYFPGKVPPGFMSPGVSEYDPDTFSYGEKRNDFAPVMRDDLLPPAED